MMAYILNCPTEINGFGYVEVQGGSLVVSEVFILDQSASATHVEIDPLVLAHHMDTMRQAGLNPSSMRFQWHSHVHMEAYFSPTDTANIDRWPGNWLISLVANKQGEFSCRLDVFKSMRVGVEISPEIVAQIPGDVMRATALEIADKVRVPGGFMRRSRGVIDGEPAEENSFMNDPRELHFGRVL
jgi:proteasome lid subunit RPN8/RPN11